MRIRGRGVWLRWLQAGLGVWLAGAGITLAVATERLAPAQVPDPLKSWVPWVMHGHEMLACPLAFNAPAQASGPRACVWPSLLHIEANAQGGSFRFEVEVFGAPALVSLPGQPGAWPQAVSVGGRPAAVGAQGQQPVLRLAAGAHVISGRWVWAQMPQALSVPRDTGVLTLRVAGQPLRPAQDDQGRLWLQTPKAQARASDALRLRTMRLIDDDVPLYVTTHYEIAVAGQTRELRLPAALLPGFVPVSLTSALPARVQDDGVLRVQVRPGNWTVQLRGRLMTPATALTLPPGLPDEVWSFAAHNDLRVVSVEGLTAVDPKQVGLPAQWQSFAAYRIKAGQAMRWVQSQRGNPQPAADQLALRRTIWLDFDGGGYTFEDRITGQLSRAWQGQTGRLEMAAAGALGRASVDGQDQLVTRRTDLPPEQQRDGVALRRGALNLSADSRIESASRELPASGWLADFQSVGAELNLPPGWRLLHARGVDRAVGSWVERWTLWDFFFVLLSVLAAAQLLGKPAGALLAAALVLTWQMPGAPQAMWLVLLALIALARVLPQGRLLSITRHACTAAAVVFVLWLLPFAIDHVRLSLYPSLEQPGQQVGLDEAGGREQAAADARFLTQEAVQAPKASLERGRAAAKALVSTVAPAGAMHAWQDSPLEALGPQGQVQTGPGVPRWRWAVYPLVWDGPVASGQTMRLYLLSPAGTVALRLGGLILLIAAFAALARALPIKASWGRAGAMSRQASPLAAWVAVMVLGAALGLGVWPASVQANTVGAQAEAPMPSTGVFPAPAWLDDLRAKLTVPPDCLPQCADVAQLSVQAQAGRLQLRMQIDALVSVEVPLPGLGAKGLAQSVRLDGQAPALRRDRQGQLWIALPAGVHQVLMDADVGEATQVDIALPMPVRAVSVQAPGWTVSGIDPRGLATGALSLSRSGSAQAAGDAQAASSDALPPFVRVTRVLQLGAHWRVHTRVQRIGPSRAPVSVRIALLAGEAVNDERVRTQEGFAWLSLGADSEAAFVSTVKEADELVWVSTDAPHQIEHWQLAPSSQWHVRWSGIAPVRYVDEAGRLQPLWQPWPGEEVRMQVSRPQGVPGQTLTFDRLQLQVRPGMRATDMNAQLHVRASQGGQHVIDLPPGAMFEAVAIDGQDQPLQPQGQQLTIPITPGAHELALRWREPRGMGWRFESSAPGLKAAGVNASTQLHMPAERVLLALGGPRLGPAILLWGVLAVWIGLAIFLGRSGITPLGAAIWAVLGLGLMQTSVLSAAAVVAWFALLAARARGFGRGAGTLAGWHPYAANALQVLLLLWTLVAALCLLNAIRVGLLGYPDMMVAGNGSSAQVLNWYQDRFTNQPQPVWVVSVPVLAYRILMLLWALWLAVSVLKWVKWAWACFSAGGYWYRKSAVLGAHSQGPTSG